MKLSRRIVSRDGGDVEARQAMVDARPVEAAGEVVEEVVGKKGEIANTRVYQAR
jgi:hypothetical protein